MSDNSKNTPMQKDLRTTFHELGMCTIFAKRLDAGVDDNTASQDEIDYCMGEILTNAQNAIDRLQKYRA